MAYLLEKKTRNPETGREEPYWRLGWRLNGKQQTLALGFVSRQEAQRLLKMHEGNRAREEAPTPTAQPSPPVAPSLEQFMGQEFLPHTERSGRAPKTILSARTSSAHLVRLMGSVCLTAIGDPQIQAYILARKKEGVRTRTIQIELGHLQQLLLLAEQTRVIPTAPKVSKPRRTDQRPHRFHSPEESAKLVQALPWQSEPSSALAIYTAIELGMRSGEIMSRRWKDIRWKQGEHGALWVGERVGADGEREWTTKTKQGRTVPLTPGLREAILAQWVRLGQPEDGWIFDSDRNRGHPITSFKASLQKACERAGVPELHPHALRHSWATRMAMGGVPKAVTMAIGGWRSPAVLEGVYQHSISGLEAEAVLRVSVPHRPLPEDEVGVRRGVLLQMNKK